MTTDEPVSGYSVRLDRTRRQFEGFLVEQRHPEGVRGIVAWIFRHARYIGIRDEHTRAVVDSVAECHPAHRSCILAALEDIDEQSISVAAHPPELDIGQIVRVILNARNLTPHEGPISERTWHHSDRRWIYIMSDGGRRVSKRYYIDDLQPVES